MIDSKLKIII